MAKNKDSNVGRNTVRRRFILFSFLPDKDKFSRRFNRFQGQTDSVFNRMKASMRLGSAIDQRENPNLATLVDGPLH